MLGLVSSTKLLLLASAVAALAGLATQPALFAQDSDEADTGIDLTISPSIIEEVVVPGQRRSFKLYLINNSQETLPIRAFIKSLTPLEREVSLSESKNFDGSTWVELNESYFFLEPEERKEIKATLRVPKKAEPGGRYTTILFEALTEVRETGETTLTAVPQVGTLVFITVDGKINEKVEYSKKDLISTINYGPNIDFSIGLANRGNIHALPTTTIVIRNMFNRIVERVEIPPRIALPNTIRQYEATWRSILATGLYSAEITTYYGTPSETLIKVERFIVVPGYGLWLLPLAAIVWAFFRARTRLPTIWRIISGKKVDKRKLYVR